MGSESMQTITDPVLRSKIPIFNGTLPSTGLSKQPNMSGLLDKQALKYGGAYTAYDPRGKDGARFSPPWSHSNTTLLDGRNQLSHLSGMMGQNHIIYRQDSTSSDESHCHSSSLRHTPSKLGFMLYTKSPEVSGPAAAVSGGIGKQKSGCENSPSHSENSVYLAIPKPVYRPTHCCNELGCMIGPTYSAERGNPSIPNIVYEHEWMQSGAHYTELSPMQLKTQDTLLQQRGLQIAPSENPQKRITVEAYSPDRTRTLPTIIEPSYSSYSCAPTRSLFGSLGEHGQLLQNSPRGYPGLYSSHPTYERMTSEVYHSPMSKYGQLAQHPVFYYPQANVEGENRAQCKDSGSKKREDIPVIHKHPIAHSQEHYIVPQSLHAEIPFHSTEMLPTHSFMPGFEYPYYAVPRFHLDASQIRSPLKRQHPSPGFHASCINDSPSSQHRHLSMATAASPHNSKPKTSLRGDHVKASSPFLLMDQPSPTRLVSQPAVSPANIQIGRFFSPLTGMHLDPAVFPPAGLIRDRHVDYSSCEAYPIQPKSLPVPPAGWKSHTPGHDSDQIQTAGPSHAKLRKLFSPVVDTANRQRGSVPPSEATDHKNDLKRSFSQVTPPIKIKQEDKDIYEVELAKKQKMTNLQVENISNFPPMPVIDTVFSLAPYLQASRRPIPSGIPQRPVHSPEQPEVRPISDAKEKTPDRDERDPAADVGSGEIHPDTVLQKVQNIKVEKVEPSDMDHSEETCVPHTDYSEVIIKKELSDGDPSDSESMLPKRTHESDERGVEPPLAAQYETSEETKPFVLPLVNSSCHGDAHSLYKQAGHQPIAIQIPQIKLDFKNIPPQCLKLNRYNIVLRDGTLSRSTVLPSARPLAQPTAEPGPKLEIHTPVRKHFLELHHSLCKLLSKSVSASSEPELKNWLSQLQMTEPKSPSTKVQQVSCLLGVKAREVWTNEEMKLALQEVLQRLNEYNAQGRCPFPHVYRTGTVFLPMLVVKELLFPMVQGSFIDQVLQEHKVGLRPTTLSEEKILIQLHKRACSSRLRRLMSLKQLPDIYADMVNILYYTYVCKHLESGVEPDRREQDVGHEASDSCMPAVFSDSTASAASPSETQTHRDMKDQETQPQWNKNRGKSRVKSSSRRMFLDNSLSDEEEEAAAADIEQTVTGGVLDSFQEEYPGTHECQETDNRESDHTAAEQESSHISQSPAAENSWTCPLTSDDLSHRDKESEKLSSLWPVDQSSTLVRPKKHPGVILKLKRMLSGGFNRKKARYQAVPELGTFADPSPLQTGDGKGVIGETTTTVTHRWQRAEGLPHALRPLSSSSKRKRRSLLKIKYCPYLSACHSAEHRKRWVLRSAVQGARRAMRLYYPDLVGKRIRHLYEEDDKSEVWYQGEVLRIHEAHTNPLKTVFEVRYDSEPEWKYYLELLIDYKKGWLKIED